MTEHLFDLLQKYVISPQCEYDNFNVLFSCEKNIHNGYERITLEEFVDSDVFRQIPLRGTFLRIEDLRRNLGIPSNLNVVTHRELFLLCELFLNVFSQGLPTITKSLKAYNQFKVITDNIDEIANKTNNELYEVPDGGLIIVEKNKAATQAADIITENSVVLQTIEYNRYLLKGDLTKKKNILTSLGSYIEPILRSKILSKNGYIDLESDAGFLLNNFHIRHNNKKGKSAQEYIIALNDAALEEWYDKAYNTMLMVVIANEQISVNSELKRLKADYAWRT